MAQVVTLKYLDLPAALGKPVAGRGGSVRFFLKYHDVEYSEQLVSLQDWNGSIKAEAIKTNESPAGYLPVLTTASGLQLTEHVALMRYIAAANHLESQEGAEGAAKQDVLASTQIQWRDDLIAAAFSSNAEDKTKYTNEKAGKHLTTLEALYTKYKDTDDESPFVSPTESGKALWGDMAVFGVLHDQVQLGLVDPIVYAEYPRLKAVYDALNGDSAIASWIANH
ncbi:hypothetical protein FVE85_6521 [Porphyridium purpureum]|uniref:GST N-terminal domain-containing protein n=1 Tax=Porphyridium purpureum TaxID=35688 RepID=A0A5J4Z5D5_PORPP|nr:hypothetical protein FVE85_6521 [Porphyridium purpureum]|eukprot:POR7835..scf295_1